MFFRVYPTETPWSSGARSVQPILICGLSLFVGLFLVPEKNRLTALRCPGLAVQVDCEILGSGGLLKSSHVEIRMYCNTPLMLQKSWLANQFIPALVRRVLRKLSQLVTARFLKHQA